MRKIDDLQQRVLEMLRRVDWTEPIAVIGLGCRFPGEIIGPESYVAVLCEGRSSVGEVPPERWALFDDGSPEATAALSGTTAVGFVFDRSRRL